MRFAAVSLFAAVVFSSSCISGCASVRSDPTGVALRNRQQPLDQTALPSPLMLSPFAGSRLANGAVPDARLTAHITSFRTPIAPREAAPPLDPALGQRLQRISDALTADDIDLAVKLVDEAFRSFPQNVEPLELMLLIQFRLDDAKGVGTTIERISRIDPSNSFVPALAGLRAAREGNAQAALGALSWFVGEGALPRRGAVVPLLSAPAEMEEQAAVAAMHLGCMQAALDALAAAREAVRTGAPDDVRRIARLELLQADALTALGREYEALALLAPMERALTPDEPRASADAIPALAAMRADAIRAMLGDRDHSLDLAVPSFLREPGDDVRLWRVVSCAAGASLSARTRALETVEYARGALPAMRATLVAAALSPGNRLLSLEQAWTQLPAIGAPIDRCALLLSMRLLAANNALLPTPLACELAAKRPNDLDAIVVALLGSGLELDPLVDDLVQHHAGPAGDALRSRIMSRFGFHEDAFALADAARSRDSASTVALAATALAAAELLDATLLDEVDRASEPSRGAIARTLATSWFLLQEMPRARARAAEALHFDATDSAARLCAALASLEDPALRIDAVAAVRALAAEGGAIGTEAWSMRAEMRESLPSGTADANWPMPASAVSRLTIAAIDFEAARLPLAAECCALIEEIDPAQRGMQLVTPIASGPSAPPSVADWSARVLAEAPALPERMRFARLHGAGADRVAKVQSIPASPLSARFLASCAAPRELLARDRELALDPRPRTPDARSLRAVAEIGRGDTAACIATVESVVQGDGAAITTLAGRRLLTAMALVVERDPQRAEPLAAVLAQLLGKMQRLSPSDMLEANRVRLASDPGASVVTAFEQSLAERARPMLASEGDDLMEVFRSLASNGADPFAAAELARALCAQDRFAPELRQRLATAAVALRIASGVAVEPMAGFVRELCAAGAPPWPAADGTPATVADALRRTGDLYSMLGNGSSADAMLRAALAVAPNDPQVLNGLAYSDLERGVVTDETISFAERAAKALPDDPGVLDTIGFLRYHQGRFQDDAAGAGAVTLFRQALRLRPNAPSLATLDHLGDALWRAGQQEEAIKDWRRIEPVARLRYPPAPFKARMLAYQARTFGVELVPFTQFIRREYGAVVARAQAKLDAVARGEPPPVEECKGAR